MGKNNPHRKIIGNLKKFENVCASKTSLTATAINRPRNVDTTAIRMTARRKTDHTIPERSTRNTAIITGTKALVIPNNIAPDVFANMRSSSDMGARSNLSNDRFFFSKVTVTASMDVVPNRIDMATTPGSTAMRSSILLPDLIKNIAVHANGKKSPQLMFGGLR